MLAVAKERLNDRAKAKEPLLRLTAEDLGGGMPMLNHTAAGL